MASVVILLSSGPTAMNASMAGSRAISAIWSVRELGDRHLVGIDAGFRQDHAQQGDVGLGAADDADAMPGKIVDLLDFRRRLFSSSPLAGGRKAPTAPTTFLRRMATDSASAGRSDRRAPPQGRSLPSANSAMLSAAPFGGDRREPNRAAVAGKGLRQRLDQLLVVASGRADRDPQGDRPQHIDKARPPRRRTGKCPRPGSAANSSSASAYCGRLWADVRLRSDESLFCQRYTKNRKRPKKDAHSSMTSHA